MRKLAVILFCFVATTVAAQDIHLFHTIARVKIPEEVTFSFTDDNADILFTNELDKMNFQSDKKFSL